MKRTAIITGSFDPITSGHLDLIRRASLMFDEVWVIIAVNSQKSSGMFTPSERMSLTEAAIAELPLKNVRAMVYDGLISEIAGELGATVIVRGARNATDYDYEANLSYIMKRFDPLLETIILPTSPEYAAISSTYVRELIRYGCDLGDAVPEGCRALICEILDRKKR